MDRNDLRRWHARPGAEGTVIASSQQPIYWKGIPIRGADMQVDSKKMPKQTDIARKECPIRAIRGQKCAHRLVELLLRVVSPKVST